MVWEWGVDHSYLWACLHTYPMPVAMHARHWGVRGPTPTCSVPVKSQRSCGYRAMIAFHTMVAVIFPSTKFWLIVLAKHPPPSCCLGCGVLGAESGGSTVESSSLAQIGIPSACASSGVTELG